MCVKNFLICVFHKYISKFFKVNKKIIIILILYMLIVDKNSLDAEIN